MPSLYFTSERTEVWNNDIFMLLFLMHATAVFIRKTKQIIK